MTHTYTELKEQALNYKYELVDTKTLRERRKKSPNLSLYPDGYWLLDSIGDWFCETLEDVDTFLSEKKIKKTNEKRGKIRWQHIVKD